MFFQRLLIIFVFAFAPQFAFASMPCLKTGSPAEVIAKQQIQLSTRLSAIFLSQGEYEEAEKNYMIAKYFAGISCEEMERYNILRDTIRVGIMQQGMGIVARHIRLNDYEEARYVLGSIKTEARKWNLPLPESWNELCRVAQSGDVRVHFEALDRKFNTKKLSEKTWRDAVSEACAFAHENSITDSFTDRCRDQ